MNENHYTDDIWKILINEYSDELRNLPLWEIDILLFNP